MHKKYFNLLILIFLLISLLFYFSFVKAENPEGKRFVLDAKLVLGGEQCGRNEGFIQEGMFYDNQNTLIRFCVKKADYSANNSYVTKLVFENLRERGTCEEGEERGSFIDKEGNRVALCLKVAQYSGEGKIAEEAKLSSDDCDRGYEKSSANLQEEIFLCVKYFGRASCGNNIKEENERCDGTDLAGRTCASFGFSQGNLKCKPDCTFDTSNCSNPEKKERQRELDRCSQYKNERDCNADPNCVSTYLQTNQQRGPSCATKRNVFSKCVAKQCAFNNAKSEYEFSYINPELEKLKIVASIFGVNANLISKFDVKIPAQTPSRPIQKNTLQPIITQRYDIPNTEGKCALYTFSKRETFSGIYDAVYSGRFSNQCNYLTMKSFGAGSINGFVDCPELPSTGISCPQSIQCSFNLNKEYTYGYVVISDREGCLPLILPVQTYYAQEQLTALIALAQNLCNKPQTLCGNGIIDEGEECDGRNLNDKTCQSLGYQSGVLKCSDDCKFNINECEKEINGLLIIKPSAEFVKADGEPFTLYHFTREGKITLKVNAKLKGKKLQEATFQFYSEGDILFVPIYEGLMAEIAEKNSYLWNFLMDAKMINGLYSLSVVKKTEGLKITNIFSQDLLLRDLVGKNEDWKTNDVVIKVNYKEDGNSLVKVSQVIRNNKKNQDLAKRSADLELNKVETEKLTRSLFSVISFYHSRKEGSREETPIMPVPDPDDENAKIKNGEHKIGLVLKQKTVPFGVKVFANKKIVYEKNDIEKIINFMREVFGWEGAALENEKFDFIAALDDTITFG